MLFIVQFQLWLVNHRKEIEEVSFVDEELLYKKIKKQRCLYVDYGLLLKIFQEDACS